jgi:hypothetical protein
MKNKRRQKMTLKKYNIPEAVKEGIDIYVETGQCFSNFLSALLENNLKESFALADENSEMAMKEIVSYLYWEIPGVCWGSKEKMKAWSERFIKD